MINSNINLTDTGSSSYNVNFSIIEKQAYNYVPSFVSGNKSARLSGKYYWEVNITGIRACLGWIPESLVPLSTYDELINNNSFTRLNTWCIIANSNGFVSGKRGATQGQVYYKNTLVEILASSGPGNYGFAIDITNGKLWVSFNGTYHNGGDPAANTKPTISETTFAPGRPLIYIDNYDGSIGNVIGKFSASTVSPPTGFTAWGEVGSLGDLV